MPFREQTPRSETILWTERQLNAWMQWNSSMSRKVLEHRFSHFKKKESLVIRQKRDIWADVALSLHWQICFYMFQPCTWLLIGTWMCEWWFVLYQPQWLIVCTGSSMGWGQDPCMPWIHQWCLACFLRDTDNMSFQWLCTSLDPAMTWRAVHSAVHFKSSKSSQYGGAHEQDTDMWLQNQDKMYMRKWWLALMRYSRWPVSMLECVSEWGLTCQC